MTVGELIKELQKEDPSRIVVLVSDVEGNSYHVLYSFWTGTCKQDTPWSVTAGLEKLTKADRREGYTKANLIEDGTPALILTP